MTSRKRIVGIGLSILLVGLIDISAQAPTVTVGKFKNVNAPGAVETDTYAVNDFGVIAGDYVDTANVQHGMILDGKKLTTVDHPNCQNTPGLLGSGSISFFGINNSKGSLVTVVGWCFDTTSETDIAFLYSKGKFIPIAPPGTLATIAQGINGKGDDKGDVVGAYLDSGGTQHGFLLKSGKYTNLDVPKHMYPNAWSVNNSGVVSIFAQNSAGNVDSFLFNGKTYKNVNVPGATDSLIGTIDDSGDRIYSIVSGAGNQGAFYLATEKGGFYTFSDPSGVGQTLASGLNNKLEIVGNYGSAYPKAGTTSSQGYSAVGCCRGLPPIK
jgi:hypothetical protein